MRSGRELASAEKEERLASQSILEELEVIGGRLRYRLHRGEGPSEGWVSLKLKDKDLVVPADTRETGKRFDAAAPIPELLCVQASDTHGTLRDVQGSLSEIEQGAWKKLRESDHKNEKSDLSSLEESIKDLLYLAWKRENRKRVVLLLAKLLQFSSEKSWDRAARIVCQQLCLVCWASSMVDVEYYAFKDSESPIVVACGFGGSHLDDLQPAIDRWTQSGAGVLAFGPARVGRDDMLDSIFSKLVSVLEDRAVIFHFFSDGGFGMARSLLGKWEESWQKGEVRQSPGESIKCMISDGAGLLPHEAIAVDEESTDMEDPMGPSRAESDADKQTTDNALGFFTGCGLNMLMTFGACQAFHEEPANSFGKTLIATANSRKLGGELASAPRGPVLAIWRLLREIPTLIVASRGDKIVPIERSELLAKWLRELPNRVLSQAQRWQDANILGQDGTAVRMLTLDKAMHCRGMVSHAKEYWEGVDGLVMDCLS